MTIENTSAAPWHIAGVATTEPAFRWTGGTCSSATTEPLAIGATCTIDITFAPTSVAVVEGSLTLLDDVGTPTALTMSGCGVAVPSSGPPPAPSTPTITSIGPRHGSKKGGTWVTIVGTNLVNVSTVLFGSHVATDVTCSATACRVRSPKGSGRVDVRIVTPAGRSAATRADRFRYTR
ncbi:MAG: IPT/TIG domain-containing protein [Ilumatobacteraceae bacterium]